ncbi:hypothetical protein [Chenggangzhangella methanolivorans]|uniref:Uncharacterized protein n=1 Tax=Chenggangzhangella methanolivorans TaxID=1437009 RepID=A0A9E6RC31_9HYPH|nr:hypothetical protein [Chenggangzhangella methanolivorans]QZO02084.1 hypothetical protein K6K41_12905 [Chenggangzhangella methanolivorans]
MQIDDLVLKALREDPGASEEDLATKVFNIRTSGDKNIGALHKRAKEVGDAIKRLTKLPRPAVS